MDLELAKKLKHIRVLSSLKQDNMATILGVAQQTISRYENGTILPPYHALRAYQKLIDENHLPIVLF